MEPHDLAELDLDEVNGTTLLGILPSDQAVRCVRRDVSPEQQDEMRDTGDCGDNAEGQR